MDLEVPVDKLAWAAGFFDGEGCIKVARQKVSYGRGFHHNLVLHITQKVESPLKEFQNLFGGKIYTSTDKRKTGYKRSEWLLINNEALNTLKLLYPYLILKQDEAKVALEYDKNYDNREKIYFKLRSLKNIKYDRK